MYRIKDEYGNIIEETVTPIWLKQQILDDFPIRAYSYEEANGIALSDGNFYGIYKVDEETGESVVPNMNNYPQVAVEEISGEPYILQQIAEIQSQVTSMQAQSTTTGEQVAEMYAVQTGDVVSKNELDAAYREGVNSYE